MNLADLIKYVMSQLGALGNAAFTFVKVFLNIFIKLLEFLVDLIKRGLG